MADRIPNIILTGFMGTGKSTVARLVAERLGRTWIDMDSVIVERTGMPISTLFAERGEAYFRDFELSLGIELSQRKALVVSTGGGALLKQDLVKAFQESGIGICLDGTPEVLLARLASCNDRPLLAATDRQQQLTRLWQQRRPLYARLPLHIDTSNLTCDEVAARVCSLAQDSPRAFTVTTPQGFYQVLVMNRAVSSLSDLLKAHDVSRHVVVVSNLNLWPLHGPSLQAALEQAGFTVKLVLVPDGEQYKTLDTLRTIYEQCAQAELDRRSAIIALGGGVVTDMAGLAAATYLRGIRYIPVPTSLLAMVDASVGGKVAVDLPQGKNLVGAFIQPLQVLIDPDYLATLPEAELACGLVEIIKAGIIDDQELFQALESPIRPPWRWLIERALKVKIDIVEQDPFENGRRAVLNLGHTFAHAFELLSDYQLPHGMAVSIGLAASAELAVLRGYLDTLTRDRIIALLRRYDLPTTWHGPSPAQVWAAMQQDKKRVNAQLRFVLPRGIGDVFVDDGIGVDKVTQALERIKP